MDVERFANSPIGRLEPISVEQFGRTIEHFAFVPDPLPSELVLEPATYAAIERTAGEIGLLEGSALNLEDPYLISMPVIRHEAQSTSALEGTISNLEDVFAADLGNWDDSEVDQGVQEVMNYVSAAERGVKRVREIPVTRRLLHELHASLMVGTEHAGSAGGIRRGQVAIGSHRDQLISEARFVPPPADEVERLYDDWEKWIHSDCEVPLVARIAISHYQFEAIHPYSDGNGRIGRLAAILMLIEQGPLSDHYLALSPYIEARRSRYIDLLAETSATGDFNPWVLFFAEALEVEARNARKRIGALLAYRGDAVTKVRDAGLKGLAVRLAEDIATYPVLTARNVLRRYDVRFQTANRAIQQLVDVGIVRETTGGNYARRFRADEVFNILTTGSAIE